MSQQFIIRGSEYQSFLTCRKQWFYQWVLGLEPKRPDNKLFFGTLFHKWLERYYATNMNYLLADLETSIWFNEQDTSGMQEFEVEEQKTLFEGVKKHYLTTYGNERFNVLGTEVEFLIKLDEDMFMTGTIDLVYEIDGKIRFMDHKTVSSIQMYVEKAEMDRQISRYWWALKQIAAGTGRIKNEEGLWVRWEDLIDKEIDGFDYNLIAKDFPREPKVLKKGTLSTDKSQKTTYELYMNKLIELDLDPEPYREMIDMLATKPDPFLKRINVVRSDRELEAAVWDLFYTSNDIHDVTLALMTDRVAMDAVTYRNIGTHCQTMCVFKNICKTAINGGNVDLVMNMEFKNKEDKVNGHK